MPEVGKADCIVSLLNSHSGRDVVVRTFSYLSLYLSGRTKGNTSTNLKVFSQELSYCRLILRLFDDFPMLQHTVNYGLGKQEPTLLLRILSVMKNLLDQAYYPIEHIAWAADRKFLEVESSSFHTAGTILWGLSSYLNIIKSLIIMSILQKKTKGLKNIPLHEKIVGQQLEYLILAMKDAADIVIAINYLPPGCLLWAGKLDSKRIGLVGTISSVFRLILLLRNIKNAD